MNKITFALFSLMFLLVGCEQANDLPDPEPKPIPSSGKLQQATLIYAVNNNNLWSDLESNTKQIVEGLRNLPEKEYEVFIFRSDVENRIETGNLYRAVSGTDPVFELVRSYSGDLIPTNPERMREVVSDFLDIDCKIKNFFFWGHGTAWLPFETDHQPTRSSDAPEECKIPELYSFGGYNFNGYKDNLNIDEIKDAIPDNAFETIWFDCCYMSNIETIYELRNKSKYIVAYPTEIWQTGLPYHHVLPKLFQAKQDLRGAAEELYNFYKLKSSAVTVAVMDMSKIEEVAKSARDVFNSGKKRPSYSGLMNYSRMSGSPLYDLGQYVREYAQANDSEQLLKSFTNALDKFVICAYTYDYDFRKQPVLPENFSGISTHLFMDNSSVGENYYRTLDWYKATYAPLTTD